MIPVVVIVGPSPAEREQAIARRLLPGARNAILLEGLPACNSPLASPVPSDRNQIVRIAAACPCCAGNLVLKVHLDRLLRGAPEHLFIALANPEHAAELRTFLRTPPYNDLLCLKEV